MSGNRVPGALPGGSEETREQWARRKDGPPRTLTAGLGQAARRHREFDPALKHFDAAYGPTDGVVTDPALRARWQTARRHALDLVLAAVAKSPWADALVLRGSMLMSAWFGAAARPPKDIDFVVVPDTWRIDEPRTEQLLDGIARAAEQEARAHGADGLAFVAADAVAEYIWTYERVPGLRLAVPWTVPGLPGGQVQIDLVFQERLPRPAVPVEVAGVVVAAASPELSLAWKLLWVSCDMYPQGKDLYDAVLLAERFPVPLDLLERVLREADEWPGSYDEPLHAGMFADAIEESDHPDPALGPRLLAALAPLFEESAAAKAADRS
ncbi:nucleotidyl transferase AbiEii/AbiGii toxin family protein [Streptomyces sp. NPDC090025]|uniref:nucleotidyl transferase AbiEii/AbiGii toxin family protein n=1 Tax=Streptomyces sp. NPDC090025 TaxID=3365922 RepID=UPI003838AB65